MCSCNQKLKIFKFSKIPPANISGLFLGTEKNLKNEVFWAFRTHFSYGLCKLKLLKELVGRNILRTDIGTKGRLRKKTLTFVKVRLTPPSSFLSLIFVSFPHKKIAIIGTIFGKL